MNKKIVSILGFFAIPLGALLLNACGPQEALDSELAFDEASDKFAMPAPYSAGLANVNGYNPAYSEYGRCNDAWDNDGDGLVDMHDPDCHINAGPLRDLSLYPFPVGHNFNPDVTKIPLGGPGVPGGFRNRDQIVRWFRFLTEPSGYVAGTKIFGPGVNPGVAPTPAPLAADILQGTAAQGNNNNVSTRNLHHEFLEHSGLSPAAAAAAIAPSNGNASTEVTHSKKGPSTIDNIGGLYRSQQKGSRAVGSQGSFMPAYTGNPDDSPGDREPGPSREVN